MTSFGASLDKTRELRRKMKRLKVYEKDIREKFIRSSGPGGQNVNKVATCVVLIHQPTGVQVKAQEERTQGLNRYKARERLVFKIEQKIRAAREKARADKARQKRQNRKRSRAAKERMLENKKKKSELKSLRKKIRNY